MYLTCPFQEGNTCVRRGEACHPGSCHRLRDRLVRFFTDKPRKCPVCGDSLVFQHAIFNRIGVKYTGHLHRCTKCQVDYIENTETKELSVAEPDNIL